MPRSNSSARSRSWVWRTGSVSGRSSSASASSRRSSSSTRPDPCRRHAGGCPGTSTWARSLVTVVGFALLPYRWDGIPGEIVTNPVGIESLEPVLGVLLAVSGVVLVISAFVALASLIVRARGADADERQQIRWLGTVGRVGGVLFLLLLVAGFSSGDRDSGLAASAADLLMVLLVVTIVLGIPGSHRDRDLPVPALRPRPRDQEDPDLRRRRVAPGGGRCCHRSARRHRGHAVTLRFAGVAALPRAGLWLAGGAPVSGREAHRRSDRVRREGESVRSAHRVLRAGRRDLLRRRRAASDGRRAR